MPLRKLSVVVTRRLPATVESRLAELFNVTLNETDAPMTREQLIAAMRTADVLVPTLTDTIDAGMISSAGENMRLIANYGAGVDHIDVTTARQLGIHVCNTPGVLAEDTADMTMALILAAMRRLKEGATHMQSGDWQGWSPAAFLGTRLGGKKLGILGMGQVGSGVAKRAAAFGMQINYHNRNQVHPDTEKSLNATYWPSFDQMLANMDVVSINCPHTPNTFHLLNARRLKLMKPTAIVINTSRGEVVDENALTRMLRAGELAGAGLDVFEHGTKINPRLRNLDNVILLPHMASATSEARIEMGEKVILNIKTFEDGHRPPDRIVPSML
ncbi:MAG: D-glycerate dehydrogenase [Amylibacter sp.]